MLRRLGMGLMALGVLAMLLSIPWTGEFQPGLLLVGLGLVFGGLALRIVAGVRHWSGVMKDPAAIAEATGINPAVLHQFGVNQPGLDQSGVNQHGMNVAGRPISASFTAADIVSRGVSTTGELGPIVPTGMTAGQVAQHLPAHEADDPLVQIAFTYLGPGGQTLRTEAMMRVPDGKAAALVTGRQVPVRYLPDRPEVATLDWDRL